MQPVYETSMYLSWWTQQVLPLPMNERDAKIASLTEDEVAVFAKDDKLTYAKNRQIAAKFNEQLLLAKKALLDLLPSGNVKKYIENNVRSLNYSDWHDFRSTIIEPRDRHAKIVDKSQKERESSQYRDDAIKWLIGKNKVYGTDFTVETAITVASEIAFTEEVEKLSTTGGYFEFSGNDTCENCKGWDGNSNRCDCGNRRVSWTTGFGHSFRSPYVIAEAH